MVSEYTVTLMSNVKDVPTKNMWAVPQCFTSAYMDGGTYATSFPGSLFSASIVVEKRGSFLNYNGGRRTRLLHKGENLNNARIFSVASD